MQSTKPPARRSSAKLRSAIFLKKRRLWFSETIQTRSVKTNQMSCSQPPQAHELEDRKLTGSVHAQAQQPSSVSTNVLGTYSSENKGKSNSQGSFDASLKISTDSVQFAQVAETRIPRRIFQTWKSKTDFPAHFARWRATWTEYNPNYEYVLWDDEDNRAFITANFPWFLNVYNSFPSEIMRVDAVRYFELFEYGGIYADLDFECLQPFVSLLDSHTGVVLGRMGMNDNFNNSLPNALMMSCKYADLWPWVFAAMIDAPTKGPFKYFPEYRTGPILLKQAVEAREQGDVNAFPSYFMVLSELAKSNYKITGVSVSIVPPTTFYPVNWNSKAGRKFTIAEGAAVISHEEAKANFPDSFAVTYWTRSWAPRF